MSFAINSFNVYRDYQEKLNWKRTNDEQFYVQLITNCTTRK